jgi:transcription initiation factor TFIID TATA-box-binding protein
MEPIEYEICSIVSSCKLATNLDREQIALALNAEYFPDQNIPFLVYKPKYTKAKVMVYRTGTIVIAGERSFGTLGQTQSRILKDLEQLGYSTELSRPWKIGNIVAKVDTGVRVPVKELVLTLLGDAEYEPETFPGVLIRPKLGKTVLLFFANGKVIITGTKSKGELKEAVQLATEILRGS